MIQKASKLILPILFVIVFLAGYHYLKENSLNAKDAKLNGIQQISKEVPFHSSFTKVGENTSSRHMDAGLYQYFRSPTDFGTVKGFYISELTQKGWTQIKDEDKLVFRKNDISLFIEHHPKASDWNYGFSYVWRNAE